MKNLTSLVILILALTILPKMKIHAQQPEADDRTLSPYFLIKSDGHDADLLPLKSTSADVNISGVIADVRVTQVYRNEGHRPIEAIYIFPASTKAAVYGMKMTIGERVINAVVRKREEARQEYEQARQNGQSASLLEQQRPNVFQMNVANIMPGDIVKVELSYTELLVPTDRIYEFVYPTVVGPRYSNQTEGPVPESEKWVQNPYLHEGETPNYTFNIHVRIAAGLPIQEVSSDSHKVNINYEGRSIATVKLDSSEKYGGNRDYVLKYRLAGEQTESGLLLYKGEKENFFLLMIQPPARVKMSEIPGREYIFIVDVSGSMHGFPLDISKKLLRDLISNLRPTDRFNVLLFAGGSSVMSESSLPAVTSNISRAVSFIEGQSGGGGTELLPALKRALALPEADGYSRTIVIATDGYVMVEEEVFDLIRSSLGNANMFAFGIGSGVNRHLIEGMANVGMGEPFIITKPEEAAAKAGAFRKLIQTPVLTDVKVDFGRFSAYDIEPQAVPDVLAERPVIVFGKWRGDAHGKITLRGISGSKKWSQTINAGQVKASDNNSALRYLWARHRIKLLSDYNMLRHDDERVNEVTGLGLTYNLLTTYTSFVAVDKEVRNKDGKLSVIKQPLPLPLGVSDYAVGNFAARSASGPVVFREKMFMPESAATGYGEPAKEEKVKGSIRILEIAVAGSVEKEAVNSTVQNHLEGIRRCYVKSGQQGEIRVEFIVSPDGTVKSVKLIPDKKKNDETHKCFTDEIGKWQFPVSAGMKATTVTVTFVFNL
ncbi:MAG: AgmX/PglI C-terminal domain-containing protein [Nitrospirae bacterium]|nr:AgmX/PglI C-terminal domain-containing protein [Nitrospirota bacterium]